MIRAHQPRVGCVSVCVGEGEIPMAIAIVMQLIENCYSYQVLEMQFNSYSIIWIHLIAYCHNETLVPEPFRHVQSSGLNMYCICVSIWLKYGTAKRNEMKWDEMRWMDGWIAGKVMLKMRKAKGIQAKIESYTDSISSPHSHLHKGELPHHFHKQ